MSQSPLLSSLTRASLTCTAATRTPRFLSVTAAALFAVLAGCGSTEVAETESDGTTISSEEDLVAMFPELAVADLKPEADRAKAPSFELIDQNGDPVTMADLQGQVVVLNFWATWCGPCRVEMPWLSEFEKKYKDQGFSVVGVSMDDEGWEKVTPFMADHPEIEYRIVIGTESMAQMYGGIASLPTTFIIDREGRVAATHTQLPEDETVYASQIEELL